MLRPGVTLSGKYRIISSLGAGGMGEVFLAEHTILEKKVAIKALHGYVATNEGTVRRFYREAQAAAALRHRGITEVYDIGWESHGRPYIVMEYLDGKNLLQFVEQQGGRLSPEAAAGITVQVLSVLAAVHQKNIIHRDLKPDNIFVCSNDEGESVVKILDFGISKVASSEDTPQLTHSGQVMGSVPYMAPEQLRGTTNIDHRVDLWGAGVVLYETITGRPPFTGGDVKEVLHNICNQPLEPPATLCREVTPSLNRIVVKALEKDPELRYQEAHQFRMELTAHFWSTGREDTDARRVVISLSTEATATRTGADKPAFDHVRAPLIDVAQDTLGESEELVEGQVRCLTVVRGLDTGSILPVNKRELTVGREKNCALVLNDESVSRRHARVLLAGGHVYLEDLWSKNGMTVNGQTADRARLHEGDLITLGHSTLLKYSLLDPAEVRQHQELYENVAFDVLTGALNRRSLETRITSEWSYAVRHDQDLSFIAMDVDGFHRVNQEVGDRSGDMVLRELARLVRSAIRGEDLFGRTGVDQFLVVLQGTNLRGALRFARRLRKTVSRHVFEPGQQRVHVTVSMGVATRKGTSMAKPQELVVTARKLLRKAKEAGGDCEMGK